MHEPQLVGTLRPLGLTGRPLTARSETGEHMEDADHELQWIPFPTCNETGRGLEFRYGVEGDINCTIAAVSDPLFHLLEFYVHSDAPLACRLPARPRAHADVVGEAPARQQHVPLVVAVAGTLQLSHMHVSTHLNVLLHGVARHHVRARDSGALDSAVAYSTSPLAPAHSRRLIIGDALPLTFSVRWLPTPALPHAGGLAGRHDCARGAVFYSAASFAAGAGLAALYTMGVVLPRRLRARALGGATPLGYGLGPVGRGWGFSAAAAAAKRMD